MTLHALLLPTLGRWLGLLALAILVGNLVLELVVLPRDLAQLESARRRLRHWITAVVALLIVTSAGDLIARAGVMTGGDLPQAMAALPLVLTRTHFGAIWISRGGALALLLAIAAIALMAVLARRQIGGYTGDVLGAFQQIGEIVMLLVAAAR